MNLCNVSSSVFYSCCYTIPINLQLNAKRERIKEPIIDVLIGIVVHLIQTQILIQTFHRLHLSDQRQDSHSHYAVNARSNKMSAACV